MEQLQYRTILLFVGIHFVNWQFDRNYVEVDLVFQMCPQKLYCALRVMYYALGEGGNIHEIC